MDLLNLRKNETFFIENKGLAQLLQDQESHVEDGAAGGIVTGPESPKQNQWPGEVVKLRKVKKVISGLQGPGDSMTDLGNPQ